MVYKLAQQLWEWIWGESSWRDSWGYVCFEIIPYKDNEFWYTYREWFLANFSSFSEPLQFSLEGNEESLRLYMYAPAKYEKYILNVFYATYNSSDLKVASITKLPQRKKYIQFSSDAEFYEATDFQKWWTYVDPFKDILALFSGIDAKEFWAIRFTSKFKKKESWFTKILQFFYSFFTLFVPKTKENEDKESEDEENKDRKKIWNDVKFSIEYFLDFDSSIKYKSFDEEILHVFDKFLQKGVVKSSSRKSSVKTNIGAFINMFHIPTNEYQQRSLHYIEYRKLPAPYGLPNPKNSDHNDLTVLGTTDRRNATEKFWIRKEDKFRHVYIVGKTWMGKSTFMSNMVRSDMHADNGIAVVDPHGDLIDDVIAHIPSHRTNDVVVFDVSDVEYPVWFNILEYNSPNEKNLVASAVVSIFKKLFSHSRWPRLEYILRNVILSILEYPNATLMHIVRMLADKNFREEVLWHVKDPVVMKFWRDEYDKWQDRQKNEAIGPIANKIWQFLSSPIVRNIFAQPKSSLNLRKIMDEWKILLVNLSKWKIWEDNASMIWSFLVSKFQIDAMSRADIDFNARKDFYLYIDEFQNFATESFESILSEARKYRLSLIVANQYTSQIQEWVRNAIFWNVWTVVSFWLWYDDATMMSQQFKGLISANDLLSLPKFKAYVKLMVDGVTTDPFTMGTFPLPDPELSAEIKEKIKKQSRQRYGTEREKLEKILEVRMNKQFTKAEKVSEKAKSMWESNGKSFSVDDISEGDWCEGLVKLKYNYWLFVTVKWVEWLLHKSEVDVPENIDSWKDLYAIGDKIRVRVGWFKVINWEKKVVRSQKPQKNSQKKK